MTDMVQETDRKLLFAAAKIIPRAGFSVVSDSAGAQWKVSDITGTRALVTIFIMGAFALVACVRLADQHSQAKPL